MNRRSLFKKLGIGIGAAIIPKPAPAEPPKDVRPCEKCGTPNSPPVIFEEEPRNETFEKGGGYLGGHGKTITRMYLCTLCNRARLTEIIEQVPPQVREALYPRQMHELRKLSDAG